MEGQEEEKREGVHLDGTYLGAELEGCGKGCNRGSVGEQVSISQDCQESIASYGTESMDHRRFSRSFLSYGSFAAGILGFYIVISAMDMG